MNNPPTQLGDATSISVPLGFGPAQGSIAVHQERNNKMRLVAADREDAVSVYVPLHELPELIRVLIARSGRTDLRLTVDEDQSDEETTALVVPDSPKMLHETLCFAQTTIGLSQDQNRATEHRERLGRLINECERHRPLGSDGKHRDLHTPTCGCEGTAG